jgi:xylulokinase
MGHTSLILGIDIGGTAVKVALFDTEGRLHGAHSTAIPVHTPHPGWFDIDPGDWRQAVRDGVEAALRASGALARDVAAIGLSNMIGTVTPLDRDGHPLRRAIPYYDTRSTAEAEWILQQAPEVPRITANRVLPGNTSLTSILWIRRHEPEVYARSASFAPTNTFMFRWLTGESGIDWTNANFVGVYDVAARDWSRDLAVRLDVDLGLLGPVVAPDRIAPLAAPAAATLGLTAGTPVAIGGLDGAMSSVGVGAIHVGDAYDVCGTSEMIAVCLDGPVAAPELLGRWHVVPGLWTLIGAMTTSGAALQWFRDRLCAPGAAAAPQDLYDLMTAEATESPPGANGVVFLPHLAGERAPWWDPHARGVFFGLTIGTTRGDMIRAVMEGTAYAMRHLIELAEGYGGIPIRRITSLGGGAAHNPLWRQIRADVWRRELMTSPVHEATALGAALTAGVGAGIYAGYAEAVERAVPREGEVIPPNPAHRAAYERGYGVYRRLYPTLAETMRVAAQEGGSVRAAASRPTDLAIGRTLPFC